jgi:hypothetical protein
MLHASDDTLPTHCEVLEAAERIALPIISSAGRRLAVLATPPWSVRAGVYLVEFVAPVELTHCPAPFP